MTTCPICENDTHRCTCPGEITFNTEKFEDFYLESVPLTEEHHKEVDLFGLELDVNLETYLAAQDAHILKGFTVRENGKLIGYSLYFVFKHTHHRSSIHAKQDVLFIQKDKRGIGTKFIKYCEDRLRDNAINFIHQAVPAMNDWSIILERAGYRKLETAYTKEL
jgi:hypothetical protein